MIILSLLGTGDYNETTYTWGRQKKSAQFMQQALSAWFPNTSLLVCATRKAKGKHGKVLRETIPNIKLINIPMGKNERQFWTIYNRIEENIPAESELVFDITHGFRSLPILALLAVAYLRAAKGVKVKHILYGAFEARVGEKTPVLDLLPFLNMLDWASATNRFLETGDARKFRPLIETKGDRPLNVYLNSAVKELDSLSQALATNRALRSGELAQKVQEKLLKAQQGEWEPRHEPLKLLLPRLADSLALLSRDGQGSQEEQLRQCFGQVEWLLQNQQFEKALGLAREWMVSFTQLRRQGSWQPIGYKERKKVEVWLNDCARGGVSTPDEWKAFIGVWIDLGNLRNDLMHFGFRDSPREETTIPKEVKDKIDGLRAVVCSMGLELPEVS
ncbi:MAG: TIGR02221 family CRISPR-associated protein [Meiothermus silvanus]|nr:TIGR02221 family CRISPR-associated protein [Allomeiothermus silvanus]